MATEPDGSAGGAMEWHPPAPYRPLGRRAKWTLVLLAVGVVVDLVAVGSDVAERLLLNQADSGGIITPEEAEANDLRQAIVGSAQGIVFTATATAFLFWFNRAYRNLTALGATALRFGYGWAVGAWFVPILSIWRPKQIANDIWRGSNPEAPPAQGIGWRDDDVPSLFTFWWLAYVFSNSLYGAGLRSYVGAEEVAELRSANAIVIGADTMGVLSGVLAFVFVRWTTRRQTERAARLGVSPEEDPTPLWRRGSAWAAFAGVAVVLALQGFIGFAAASGSIAPEGSDDGLPGTPSGSEPGLIFEDDFLSRRDLWLEDENATAETGYTGGTYSILVKERDSLWSSFIGLGGQFPAVSFEVDTTLHDGNVRTDFWGVACLGASEGGYLLGISPDGYHTIGFDPGGDEQLDFRRLEEEFERRRFGPRHAETRLRADCTTEGEAALLRIYVDGVQVAERRHRGEVGEYIGVGLFVFSGAGGTDVRFDDASARTLPESEG